MRSSRLNFLAILVILVFATQSETASAAISWTGDVDPADPTSWNLDTIGVPLPIILS